MAVALEPSGEIFVMVFVLWFATHALWLPSAPPSPRRGGSGPPHPLVSVPRVVARFHRHSHRQGELAHPPPCVAIHRRSVASKQRHQRVAIIHPPHIPGRIRGQPLRIV